MTDRITLTAPDDWHIHLRDGDALRYTVKDAARQFRRAIIMPNLVPPVLNASQALEYKERICSHIPQEANFQPLMVLYLTDNTSPEDIVAAKNAGVVACKLYPAGATTNSASGVTDVRRLDATLEKMAELGVLLLVHGEVTDAEIDIFDREAVFIEKVMVPLLDRVTDLKVVFEHITTQDAVEFIQDSSSNIAATITAHHLMFNRNHMLVGGIKPHYYCLPILKRLRHQEALVKAATGGSGKFFLGTDSAPHSKNKKESACGCAGSYTVFAAMALYAETFERAGALDKLEGFASHFGPDFYGLSRNDSQITLIREPWEVPQNLDFGNDHLIPLMAGETLNWRLSA